MNKIFTDYINAVELPFAKKETRSPDELGVILRQIVSEEGVDVYQDVERLSAALKKKDVELFEIKQIELAVCGSSLTRYLEQLRTGLTAIDMNNILRTTEKAGLAPQTARRVVSNILYSLNVPQTLKDVSVTMKEEDLRERGIYIPPEAYRQELVEMNQSLSKNQPLAEDKFILLNQMMAAGVPEAYRLAGEMYLDGVGVAKDDAKALELLQYAAAHGDSESYGLLGDYFYNRNNGRAFAYYTRPGALAVGESRWNKLRSLEGMKSFSRVQVILMTALCLLLELFMFMFQKTALTGTHIVPLIIGTILNGLILAGVYYIHWKDPYQDLRNFALPFLGVFVLFTLLLL